MSIHPYLKDYQRPTTLQAAFQLLQQHGAYPLLGDLSSIPEGAQIEVAVDMQSLGLSYIKRESGLLKIGGMATLQAIYEESSELLNGLLAEAARRESGWNGRNTGTIAGLLSAGRAQGPLGVMLACLGAQARYASGTSLSFDGQPTPPGDFLAEIQVPVQRAGLSYQQVGRTRADYPILSAAAQARVMDDGYALDLCVGGLFERLLILSFSGKEADVRARLVSLASTLQGARRDTRSDYLGSADYRLKVAPVLARRAMMEALAQLGVKMEGAGA